MIGNCKIMGIINLTPDSFQESSRVRGEDAADRIRRMRAEGADIIDLGAVSTRPGAGGISEDEEWRRLEPALKAIRGEIGFSIDTTRSGIVRRAFELAGPFTVNDISAGEDDPLMLGTVGELGLEYIAMHKRGTPATMDSLSLYPEGIVPELKEYFAQFAAKAHGAGIEKWIMDPGLGFAKTPEQCVEILERLPELRIPGVPVLVGAAGKRFTLALAPTRAEGTRIAHRMALAGGADILRVHNPADII